MTILELLNNNVLNLPKTRTKKEAEIPFPNYVLNKLQEYYNLIEKLDNFMIAENDSYNGINNNELIKNQVKNIKNGIIQTIFKYYDGNPIQAYNKLNEVLIENANPIENIKPYLSLVRLKESQNLYRLRKNDDNSVFTKGDLFHVPYEKREKITTKRFSISGYPSLYLSNSVFTAAMELELNSLQDAFGSRFKINVGSDVYSGIFYLLDLTNKTNYYRNLHIENNRKIDGQLMRYLITWPLIMATSIRVSNSDNEFLPEYIISQLLLMWIRNSGDDVSGIKYSSSHISFANPNFNGEFYNVVIPCKSVTPNGYCHYLKRLFNMTNPQTFSPETIELLESDFEVKTIDDNKVQKEYMQTDYSKLEKKLISSKIESFQ